MMRCVTAVEKPGGTNVMMSPALRSSTGTSFAYTTDPLGMVPVMDPPVIT